MKRILCYGDSNTWGQSDHDTRYPKSDQWPMALQKQLGEDYHIVQEGLGGRNAGSYDGAEHYRNGQEPFEVIYRSAAPVDLLIVSLGTNDLKTKYAHSARHIADDLLWYQRMAQHELAKHNNGHTAKVLYVCPANFTEINGYFEGGQAERTELIELMRQFEAPAITTDELPIGADGVHYTAKAHHLLAQKLTDKVKEILV